ncbi:MAG: hypothetical protein AMJ91_03215 [candidate division Zixibacteria bacterium SM23_73_3]|nr:MAG: hypothetical protein AMJ91_03215 [candidate division Zixibacteria bacterium SM23_73_3]
MIYNFRIDRSGVHKILRRLKEKKMLSQGWGGGEEANLRINQDSYVKKCSNFYTLASTRIPTNPLRMKDFKDGDIIVTPHLPENGKVSIHIVDGNFPECYDYLEKDPYHLNNRFKIKKSYGLDGNISIYNVGLASWYGKLQWLRLPVLPIEEFEASFEKIIQELEKKPDARFEVSELDEYLDSQLSYIIRRLKDSLNSISASNSNISFESICEHLLSSAGYRIEGRRIYDSTGGDVDLRCTRERTDLSPFEAGQTILFVQVKKHLGTTDEWAVKQLLKMIEKEPEADGCVMSLADSFSKEAQTLADRNGILLMNGDTICRLLLRNMVA